MIWIGANNKWIQEDHLLRVTSAPTPILQHFISFVTSGREQDAEMEAR